MKHIQKGTEPGSFSEWKALANENWQPTYDKLAGDVKSALKQTLMKDQGFICCYCEQRIDNSNSHIEHFLPQSTYPESQLDFGNLLCSCQKRLAKKEPRHCGSLRLEWFDETLLVSPLDPNCETRFAYSGDDGIRPVDEDDLPAVKTIEKVGLNIEKLRALRKAVIDTVADPNLSEKDFLQFVTQYQKRDSEGKFGEFCTTIGYLFPM